jgi:hypothetical protein
MIGNRAKTLTGDEKSLVEVHRKGAKMLDLRAFFVIWAIEPKDVEMIQIIRVE